MKFASSLLILPFLLSVAVLAHPRERASAAFDGQYQTNPVPGPGNNAVEWWWFQTLGPHVGSVVPSFEAIFYEGFAFTRAPTDPSWSFAASGVLPNGTTFFINVPISSAPAFAKSGQLVSGNWGNGLGAFTGSPDMQTYTLTFNAPSYGITGSLVFKSGGTPPNTPCGNNQDVYFDSILPASQLSSYEKILFEQTGWVIPMARATVTGTLNVLGTQFTIGGWEGYHDHNWTPSGFDTFAYTWLTGQGSFGPYDIKYLQVQAKNSTRSLQQAMVAHNGQLLQNQCGLATSPIINITLTGQTTDAVTGQQVPTGLTLEYTISGEKYRWALQNTVEVPSQVVYHRWRIAGSGGKVGGTQYPGALIGDWLNPGLASYTEGQSIFKS